MRVLHFKILFPRIFLFFFLLCLGNFPLVVNKKMSKQKRRESGIPEDQFVDKDQVNKKKKAFIFSSVCLSLSLSLSLPVCVRNFFFKAYI